ncbi:type II toxin-antitoxin system RelE/ParE family toxin [Marinomonas transparens]|uniref:Toxin n=1 Tax=Marinomonas transparens TaxID=2795388 RepID=A0A934N440_9GAMM|nr:type II toxin-antitoxin system RelE/ParE family toxin [Marinomonas transparens]MBJ7539663.1 type II toxin-antitoxin system RelE/ParE family toxin [Marinomonas transparens]
MAEYRLTPKARNDMEAVWLYSLKQWGTQQTTGYIDDLTEAFNFLSKSPKAGKACDNIRTGYRKHPVLRHVIYYRETAYGVEVIRVLHDRMLATRSF